jgi:hypothetical protein
LRRDPSSSSAAAKQRGKPTARNPLPPIPFHQDSHGWKTEPVDSLPGKPLANRFFQEIVLQADQDSVVSGVP